MEEEEKTEASSTAHPPVESSDATTGSSHPDTSSGVPSGDDPMLGFLTLLAKVERPACANCESKDLTPMFFCNTCGQAICATCKQNTHSAKMFSRHDVTSVSPYSKEPQRKCPVHHELCIMFSPANESLLCINCFRDLPPDIRAQCLDLDTAYEQKCERLQRGLKAVSELEVTIKDEAGAYRSLLKELQINAMREESTIHVFSKILQGVITATEDKLIEAVKSELQSKEMLFEEKLKTLESLQSNVQAYLTLSTAFISSASKFELLKLANGLVERLSDIGAVVQPTKISPENSAIASNFKAAFSQSLKELFHQELWMHSIDLHHPSGVVPIGQKESPVVDSSPVEAATAQQPNRPSKAPPPPLPFLGRSQSLVNISLNLDQQQVEPSKTLPAQPARRARRNHGKFQSLPHKPVEHQQHRTSRPPAPSTRSKSVEAAVKSAAAHQQQHQFHHDVSQVELFASIQSRQAVATGRHNGKNSMTLTSALVGVRQSAGGRPAEKSNGKMPEQSGVEANKSNPAGAGHLCVVQAMVHQDGDNRGQQLPTDPPRPVARQQPQRSWAETATADSSSIELTADQVRQLIRAISAAQQQAAATSSVYGSQTSNQVPAERDIPAQPSKHQLATCPASNRLQRSDSFEGHEEAVQLLVDAVREIKQFCTSKQSGCEHNP